MYEFNPSVPFNDNIRYFMHIVLKNVWLSNDDLDDVVDYLKWYSEEDSLADDMLKYLSIRYPHEIV